MKRMFAVFRAHGPAWDRTRTLDAQVNWRAHADFMNALEADGFAILAGPLEGSEEALLIISAANDDEIRARLAADPWREDMLMLSRIAPWTVRLGEHRLAAGAS